jgi:hypothetical protein
MELDRPGNHRLATVFVMVATGYQGCGEDQQRCGDRAGGEA